MAHGGGKPEAIHLRGLRSKEYFIAHENKIQVLCSEIKSCSFISFLLMAAFVLQGQTLETKWSKSLKDLLSDPLQKKIANC